MYERKLKAREWDQNGLVPRAVKRIELLKTYSHHYRLEGFEKDQWLVLNDSGTRWILNLEEHTCICNVWKITGLPCVHAVKVIDQQKYEWVGHYHRVAAYVATYNQVINPIADSSEWGEHFRAPRQEDPNARGEHGGYRATQTSRGLAHWSGTSGKGEPSNRVANKAAPVRPP
ncbi:hypothetical protein GIB67_002676 [Kingdonia uniflora]|uniref:SWIM-type domain-containing protein n=1 Tax=Kingdonia uniflora TaxID=39325 RepID=A0A7J7LJU2_9MAGN|nr:hypothetical protein GIB67_002676 [Kingdonia uniflora]